MNLSLDADAYDILEQLDPSKRAYGHLLSQMLRDRAREATEETLTARVASIEAQLARKK